MTENPNDKNEQQNDEQPQRRRMNLPSIEDGGLVDHTVASPALGFGMDRAEISDEAKQLEEKQAAMRAAAQQQAEAQSLTSSQAMSAAYQQPGVAPSQEPLDTLAKNEVAAVSVNDRSYYVSDAPSPYLTNRQAREDVETTKRRHSRIVTALVIIFLVGVLGAGSWFLWSVIGPEPPKSVERYESTEIVKGEYLETIETTSLVRPVNEVVVTSGVSGTVTDVFVENGTDVQEGEQLFHLDNPTITDAVTKAQEAFDTLSQDVQKKTETLQKANEDLAKAQSGTSTSDTSNSSSSSTNNDSSSSSNAAAIESATNRVNTAQSDLNAANINLASIQETLNQAIEQLNTLDVYAPISGTINELSDQAKTDSTVSGSTRLCLISDTSRYSIVIEIPKTAQNDVEVGQEVRLTFPAIEGLEVTSTVSSIDGIEDEESDVLFATVIIEEPDERITTGIATEASVVLKSIPDTYIVPFEALHTSENGSTHLDVLLDPSRGIVTEIPVKVLAADSTKAAVEADNIQAGTAVVLSDVSNESSSSSTAE